MPNPNVIDYTGKIALVGLADSGKSAILQRFLYNTFSEEEFTPTEDIAFARKVFDASDDDDTKLTLHIWDMSLNDISISSFLAGADIIYLCINANNYKDQPAAIINHLQSYVKFFNGKIDDATTIELVLTKVDMLTPAQQQALKNTISSTLNITPHMTSAKNGTAVHETFQNVKSTIIKRRKAYETKSTKPATIKPSRGLYSLGLFIAVSIVAVGLVSVLTGGLGTLPAAAAIVMVGVGAFITPPLATGTVRSFMSSKTNEIRPNQQPEPREDSTTAMATALDKSDSTRNPDPEAPSINGDRAAAGTAFFGPDLSESDEGKFNDEDEVDNEKYHDRVAASQHPSPSSFAV